MSIQKSYIIGKINRKQNNQSYNANIVYIFFQVSADCSQFQIDNNIKLNFVHRAVKMLMSKPSKELPVATPDFIRKLHNMIQRYPDTISYSQDGSEVLIHNQHKFQGQILPVFFRHNNWRSFVRQMNMYSFRKINRVNQTYIFINTHFKRGNEEQFDKIKRKINSKDQQLQNQRDIEAEVKAMVTQQCINLGIPNNLNLLNSLNNLQSQPQQNHKCGGSLITMPSVIIPNVGHPSLKTATGKQSVENMNASVSQGQPPIYINSITYFLSNIIKFRHDAQKLLSQLKGSIENVAKQRKQVDNKNLLAAFKDSAQLIEQMSDKMKQKMQNYVNDEDQYVGESMRGINKPNCQMMMREKAKVQNNEMDGRRQPIIPLIKNSSSSVAHGSSNSLGSQPQSKQCKAPQVVPSYNSSSSLNVIITKANHVANSLKSQQQVKKQEQFQLGQPINKKIYNNTLSMNNAHTNNNPASNAISMNANSSANNNLISKANSNLLGLSSLCSFSSVTHLLNFDRQ